MPPNNLALTEDKGGFMQAILDADPFRFSGGIRFDTNSIYGSSVNPRVSAIYKFSKRGALKLWYGEAFQEPPPLLLWGGFSGRNANEDLEPEKARNTELILMLQNNHIFSDFSLYFSRYDDVIKEEGENAGTRDIWGVEYKLKLILPNFISSASDMTGYFNYTYTNAKSSIQFNHQTGVWENGETDLGDIAPHKISAGLNLPVSAALNFNLRGNLVSRRKPYSRNALRGLGLDIGRYYVLHGTVNYIYQGVTITLKALNMTDNQFFHPGGEQADSGIDFANRSGGFRNSLIPQPGRTLMIKVALGL
jgi:iron complex outermembrane receptor protein